MKSPVRQAMMNILVNAIEATPAGGSVTVTLRYSTSSATISVADTGSGLPADPESLFEPFISHKPNGVGLGLFITRQVIASVGGSVTARSTETGAQFTVTFPIDQEHTLFYVRPYQGLVKIPVLGKLFTKMFLPLNLHIIRQDRAVVNTHQVKASQLKSGEKLFPADRPILEYRKKRQALIDLANDL